MAMNHSVYKTTCNDIYKNLATEAYLMESCGDRNVLFIWQNKPTVVIGRYQNPFLECDLQKMKEKGICLSRRFSGGGAVFHDLGNLCFTMICPQDRYDKDWNYSVVLDALQRCGIKASVSGRNDILVDGFKVSGSAFQIKGKKACHHGTLLVDCDMSQLPAVLTPNKQKLESHGIKSVSSRVSNLKAIRPDVTIEMISNCLIEAFNDKCDDQDDNEVIVLNDSLILTNDVIKETYELLSSDDWLYGNTPRFADRLYGRTSRGDVVFQLDVDKATITKAEIFSDNLSTEDVELLMKTLEGLRYDSENLLKRAEKSDNVYVSESLAILAHLIQE